MPFEESRRPLRFLRRIGFGTLPSCTLQFSGTRAAKKKNELVVETVRPTRCLAGCSRLLADCPQRSCVSHCPHAPRSSAATGGSSLFVAFACRCSERYIANCFFRSPGGGRRRITGSRAENVSQTKEPFRQERHRP